MMRCTNGPTLHMHSNGTYIPYVRIYEQMHLHVYNLFSLILRSWFGKPKVSWLCLLLSSTILFIGILDD